MKFKYFIIASIGITLLYVILIGLWGPSYSFSTDVKVKSTHLDNYIAYVQKANNYNAWKSGIQKVQSTEDLKKFFLTISEEGEIFHRLEKIDSISKGLEINVTHPYYSNQITLIKNQNGSILLKQTIKGSSFIEHIFMPFIVKEIAAEYESDYKKVRALIE